MDPAGDEVEAASGGYVVLDAQAREAGWSLRVGGWCFPLSGDAPVEVPANEWVLVERRDAEQADFQFLHPTPGLLLSVRGAELELELSEVGELLEAVEPVESD